MLEELGIKILAEIKNLGTQMNEKFAKVDEKFEAIQRQMDEKFAEVDRRFVEVDARFESILKQIDERFAEVDARFESILKQMDERFAEVEQRFLKLEEELKVVQKSTIIIEQEVIPKVQILFETRNVITNQITKVENDIQELKEKTEKHEIWIDVLKEKVLANSKSAIAE